MFTQSQILEISKKLRMLGVQDSDIPSTSEFNGNEEVIIIQDGKNLRIPIKNIMPDTSEYITTNTAIKLFVDKDSYNDLKEEVDYSLITRDSEIPVRSGPTTITIVFNNNKSTESKTSINAVIPAATIEHAGLMTAEDKEKLDNIEGGGFDGEVLTEEEIIDIFNKSK